jgi:hypothetical protein
LVHRDEPRLFRDSRLPILAVPITDRLVNNAACPLLRLLALVWLALGMSVPVSAWTVHNAAHGAAQVSVDEHHHHDDDGGISVHEHDDGETPDGGHDHMPSILLGAVTVPQAGVSLTEPIVLRQAYVTLASRVAKQHTSDGLRRPPKLG